MGCRAVFLDRDGLLIADRGCLTSAAEIDILDGVCGGLKRLSRAGFKLIVVTNQAVVARGLITEAELSAIHAAMSQRFTSGDAPNFDVIYYCPHHPNADVLAYRQECDCRKPRAGLLLRAAREHGVDLMRSFMVGDRITDIIAGTRAGCATVQVVGPMSAEPPIVGTDPADLQIRPDYLCQSFDAAARWITAQP